MCKIATRPFSCASRWQNGELCCWVVWSLSKHPINICVYSRFSLLEIRYQFGRYESRLLLYFHPDSLLCWCFFINALSGQPIRCPWPSKERPQSRSEFTIFANSCLLSLKYLQVLHLSRLPFYMHPIGISHIIIQFQPCMYVSELKTSVTFFFYCCWNERIVVAFLANSTVSYHSDSWGHQWLSITAGCCEGRWCAGTWGNSRWARGRPGFSSWPFYCMWVIFLN